jgi:hypothetical protein
MASGGKSKKILVLPSITTGRAAFAKQAEAVFSACYLEYQYTFVEFFVKHLTDASVEFDGDLQQMLIVAIIGQAKIRAVKAAIEAGQDPGQAMQTLAGISASRLSDITSVPRQTVRRKLAAMRDKGWIEQDPDGLWHIAVKDGEAVVRDDLGSIDARSLGRIARLYSDLHFIVVSKGK